MKPKLIFKILLLILTGSLIFLSAGAKAQNPPGIDWKEIEIEKFKILFPSEIKSDAVRVANTLKHIYPHLKKTVGPAKSGISIILFNRLTEPNGYVSLPPLKSVWYNTPPQTIYAGVDGWYEHLSLHEGRHILQFDSLDVSTARLFYFLFGDVGRAIAMFGTVPNWYFEGDAVIAETVLSKSGRGRMPQFDAQLRAQLLSGKQYDYYQSIYGSYKDKNPLESPYLLGYYLLSKIRRDHGAQSIMAVNRRAMGFPVWPYRYTHCMDSILDTYAADHYEETILELKKVWENQLRGIKITDAQPVQKINKDDWTKNQAPQYTGKGEVVLYRYGMDDPPQIVAINKESGDERVVAMTGYNYDLPSVRNNKVIWTEEIPDERWSYQTWSDIYTADIETGDIQRITFNSTYFAPALSPDMKKIAAVEFNRKNKCSLVILNADDGSLISRLPNKENEMIRTPSWSVDGKSVVFSKTKRSSGKGIFSCSVENNTCRQLSPYGDENIQFPVMNSRYLFYVSPYSGIDNIYAMDLKTGRKFQVTSRKFGAYYPSLSGDNSKLLFSDVTSDGYVAVEMPLDKNKWIPIEEVEVRNVNYFEPLIGQEAGGNILDDIPDDNYEIDDYSHILGTVNIHSWSPYLDIWGKEFSLFIASTNILNTTYMGVGYLYNWNENTHTGIGILQYSGLYPVIELSGQYGTRTSTYTDSNGIDRDFTWHESGAELGIQFPFNFSRRRWNRSLVFYTDIEYTFIRDMEVSFRNENNNGEFIPVSYGVSFSNTTAWIRDINPRWGQIIDVNYSHTPIKGDYQGYLFSTQLSLYFPGIFSNNSLFFKASYEYQDGNDYRFSSNVLFVRGYSYSFHKQFVQGSVNYLLPILYPDLNVLWIAYIKQIYFNIFYDHGFNIDHTRHYYRSVGCELMFELRPLSYNVPFHIGVRYSYAFDLRKDPHVVGLIFSFAVQ